MENTNKKLKIAVVILAIALAITSLALVKSPAHPTDISAFKTLLKSNLKTDLIYEPPENRNRMECQRTLRVILNEVNLAQTGGERTMSNETAVEIIEQYEQDCG